MMPQIPPSVVRVLCRRTLVEQARLLKITVRHLHRLLSLPWSEWKIDRAQKWCQSCGLDFWNLKIDATNLRRVNWTSQKPFVLGAIQTMHRRAYGANASKAELIAMGKKIEEEFGHE